MSRKKLRLAQMAHSFRAIIPKLTIILSLDESIPIRAEAQWVQLYAKVGANLWNCEKANIPAGNAMCERDELNV